MEKQQYLKYREEKVELFMSIVKEGLAKDMTARELKALEFGFIKGLDTATKGGTIVNE